MRPEITHRDICIERFGACREHGGEDLRRSSAEKVFAAPTL